MLGSIIGDIVGSKYEFNNIKTKKFELFSLGCNYTDDSILTIATADWLINGGDVGEYYQKYAKNNNCPKGGYGGKFTAWVNMDKPEPYGSWGNGSAMRVSPIGWFYENLSDVLVNAAKSAKVTHNSEEGIKGAQAVAASIFLLRKGYSKEELKGFIVSSFDYNLDRTCDEIRPTYRFDVSCQGTVPEAIIAFLESTSFEDAIRNAVSLGGDCDTLTCICGAIAEAYYGIPNSIAEKALKYLPNSFKDILMQFKEIITFVAPKSGETASREAFHKEMHDICEWDTNKPIIPCLVDFDGSIVVHAYPEIGQAVPNALELMREYTNKYNVGWILDTMRSEELLEDAVNYLKNNGIKLYGIGKHPTQDEWTKSNKAYGILRWDDNSAGVPLTYTKNNRPFLNWKAIDEKVRPLLQNLSGNFN